MRKNPMFDGEIGGHWAFKAPHTPANATAQAMPGEFPWDPVDRISLEAESVDWKGIQL